MPSPTSQPIVLQFDGSSRNNGRANQEAAAAAVAFVKGETIHDTLYLGSKTNNEAEFEGFLLALEIAKTLNLKEIQIQGDSLLVIETITGKQKIKARNLIPYVEKARQLLTNFDFYEIKHVEGNKNKITDKLCNETLNLKDNIQSPELASRNQTPTGSPVLASETRNSLQSSSQNQSIHRDNEVQTKSLESGGEPIFKCLGRTRRHGTLDQEAASAVEIRLPNAAPLYLSSYQGSKTVHEASLNAIKLALQTAQTLNLEEFKIQTASHLAYQVLTNNNKLKEGRLLKPLKEIQDSLKNFKNVRFEEYKSTGLGKLEGLCVETMDTKLGEIPDLNTSIRNKIDSSITDQQNQESSKFLQTSEIQIFIETYNRQTQAERSIVIVEITNPETKNKEVFTKITRPENRMENATIALLDALRHSRNFGAQKVHIQSNNSGLITFLTDQKEKNSTNIQTGNQQQVLNTLESMNWSVSALPTHHADLKRLKEEARYLYQAWTEYALLGTKSIVTPNATVESIAEGRDLSKLKSIDRKLIIPVYNPEKQDPPKDLVMKNTLIQALFPSASLEQVEFGDKPELVLHKYHNKELDIITGGAKRGAVFFSNQEFSKIFWDNPEDAVAYGSNLMSECLHVYEGNMRVMVVRDEVYETGDCHAKVSPELARELGAEKHAIQYRLGYLEQSEDNQIKGKLVKGTAVPHPLCTQNGVDLIIPESAFKSSLKVKLSELENERTFDIPKASFGLFRISEMNKTTVSHTVLQYFSDEAIKADVFPHMRREMDKLQGLSFWLNPDIATTAKEKLTIGTARPQSMVLPQESFQELISEDVSEFEEGQTLNSIFDRTTQITAYDTERIFKDIPQVQGAYQESLGRRWRDIALKGGLTWPSGVGLPTTELKDKEIFCHELPEGEYMMIRYPLRYEHDVIVVTNKHLVDPHKMILGSIWMNSTTAAMLGGDFDGDRYVLGNAKLFPNLAREAREREKNRYEIDIPKNKMKSPWTKTRIIELLQKFSENHIGRLTNLGIRAYAHHQFDIANRIPIEMQKAVMMFKHAISPDIEWLTTQEKEVKNLSWLQGKKDAFQGKRYGYLKDQRTYIDYPLMPDPRLDSISQMIHYVNQKWNGVQAKIKSSKNTDVFGPFRNKEYIDPKTEKFLQEGFTLFNKTTKINQDNFQKGHSNSKNYYEELQKKLTDAIHHESRTRETRMKAYSGKNLNDQEQSILLEYCAEKCAYMAMHKQAISNFPNGRFGIYLYRDLMKKVNRREKDFHISGELQKNNPAVAETIEKTRLRVSEFLKKEPLKSTDKPSPIPETLVFINIKPEITKAEDGTPKKIVAGYLMRSDDPHLPPLSLGEILNFTKPGGETPVSLQPGTYLCELTDSGETLKFKGFIDASKLKTTNKLVSSQDVQAGVYSVLIEPAWIPDHGKKVMVYQVNDNENGVKPIGYLEPDTRTVNLPKGHYEVIIAKNPKTGSLELTTYRDPLDVLAQCPSKAQRFEKQINHDLGHPDEEAKRIILNQLATKITDQQLLDHLAKNPNVTMTKTEFPKIHQPATAKSEENKTGQGQEVQGFVYNLILKTFNPITQTFNGYTTLIAAYENKKTGVRVSADLNPSKKLETFNNNMYFQASSSMKETWNSQKGIWVPPDRVYIFNSLSELQAAASLKKDEQCCFAYAPFKEINAQGTLQPENTLPLHVQDWIQRYNLPVTLAFADTERNREQARQIILNLRQEAPSISIKFQPPAQKTWEQALLEKNKNDLTSTKPNFNVQDPHYYLPCNVYKQNSFIQAVELAHGLDIAQEIRSQVNQSKNGQPTMRLLKVNGEAVLAPPQNKNFIEIMGAPNEAKQVFIFEDTMSALKFSRDLRQSPQLFEKVNKNELFVISAERSVIPINHISKICQETAPKAEVAIVKTDKSDDLIMKTLKAYHPTVKVTEESTIRQSLLMAKTKSIENTPDSKNHNREIDSPNPIRMKR